MFLFVKRLCTLRLSWLVRKLVVRPARNCHFLCVSCTDSRGGNQCAELAVSASVVHGDCRGRTAAHGALVEAAVFSYFSSSVVKLGMRSPEIGNTKWRQKVE